MEEDIELKEAAPWLLGMVVLAGAFLRVFLLGDKGMWLDETFSVWLANQSVGDMLQWIIRIDPHPPLYYLLLHYWVALNGDTPYYARLLSALFGAATIPIIYLIGSRLSGVVVGLAAAVFLALSTFNIYFAQEARMYTFFMFNVAVAIYALVRLLTDPRSDKPIGSQFRDYLRTWRTPESIEPQAAKEFSYKSKTSEQAPWRVWISRHRWPAIWTIETDLAWVTFIVFSAAALLSHNTAVLFVLAVNLFVLGLMLYQKLNRSGSQPALQAPSLWNWVKAQTGIFLLWSPWIVVFIQQAGRVNQEFWIPPPTWKSVTRTLQSLLNTAPPDQNGHLVTWLLCAVLGLGLVYFRKRLAIFMFLLVLFAIPIFGELMISIHRPIFLGRTLIWLTIPLFLVLAAGIAQLRFRLLMIVVMGVLVTNYLFADGDYYRFAQKEDWGTAAGYVANFAEKGDLVLFNSNFVVIPFNYYFKTYEDLYAIEVEKHGLPLDLFDSGVLEPKMTENDVPQLISSVRGRDRIWLVYSHDSYTDPEGLIPQTLASQMKLMRTREFSGGEVQLYGVPD